MQSYERIWATEMTDECLSRAEISFSYKDNNITQQHAGQSRDILKLLWDNILHWSNQKKAEVNN